MQCCWNGNGTLWHFGIAIRTLATRLDPNIDAKVSGLDRSHFSAEINELLLLVIPLLKSLHTISETTSYTSHENDETMPRTVVLHALTMDFVSYLICTMDNANLDPFTMLMKEAKDIVLLLRTWPPIRVKNHFAEAAQIRSRFFLLLQS